MSRKAELQVMMLTQALGVATHSDYTALDPIGVKCREKSSPSTHSVVGYCMADYSKRIMAALTAPIRFW